MGNRITSKRNNDPVSVKMNSGLTDAVLCILAVRGSALASTEREKNMMVCFASHDQSVYGRGAVGFDLSDLPWHVESFEAEKQFLLKVIASSRVREYCNTFHG